MSYARLIADTDHPEPSGEELLDQVVFFIVERRPTEMRHRSGVHHPFAVTLFLKGAFPGVPDALGDHIHRRLEVQVLPCGRVRPPILDLSLPARVRQELETVRAFGAEPPARNRRLRVTFNGDQLSVLVINKLPTTDGTIGTNRAGHLGIVVPRAKRTGSFAHCLGTRPVSSAQNLPDKGPASK